MEIEAIAVARNGFSSKFGIPRQSREESQIETRIVFLKGYQDRNMLRGIEAFSHLWIVWGFSAAQTWSATVRPPRLGGNQRMGVLATRSPFRPNHLGLTSVRLLRVQPGQDGGEGLELVVAGADLMDGTPVYDIKPYLSFSDAHPDAVNGFADETRDYCLPVDWSRCVNQEILTAQLRSDWEEILRQDPRPAYQDDERVYAIDYAEHVLKFVVQEGVIYVMEVSVVS